MEPEDPPRTERNPPDPPCLAEFKEEDPDPCFAEFNPVGLRRVEFKPASTDWVKTKTKVKLLAKIMVK
jgi:hypothetical protein